MKKPMFSEDNVYHIYNRGVDKRDVFMDTDDHFRFIHDLYEFNDETPADNVFYRNKSYTSYEVQPRKNRQCLVEILAYALMPNHYHIMVRQRMEDGIVRFMQKIGTGYTYYFNEKYDRSGALFQGRFKAIQLETDEHFHYLPYYIHLNPLDMYAPEWREGHLENAEEAMQKLSTYRWSSHLDYTGKKNFPSLLHVDSLRESLGSPEQYLTDLGRHLTLLHGVNAPREIYHDAD